MPFYKKGFTIIELIVYIAGLVMILSAISFLIINIYGYYSVLTLTPRVDTIGISLIDRLTKDIRSAEPVNLSESSFDVPTGSITINSIINNIEVIKYFALQDGRVVYTENGGSVIYLSPDDLSVSKLEFTLLQSPISIAVRYEVQITFPTKNGPETKSYTGLSVLRYSYE